MFAIKIEDTLLNRTENVYVSNPFDAASLIGGLKGNQRYRFITSQRIIARKPVEVLAHLNTRDIATRKEATNDSR